MSFKDKYWRKTQLGQGSFGTVYLAVCKTTGKQIAWKTFFQRNKSFEEEGLDSTTLREIVITKQLQHPNIRQILDINYDTSKLEVAFEYVATDLRKYIAAHSGGLAMRHVKFIVYQLLLSVSYIHSKQIIHRDIKPANIFVEGAEYPHIKLGDFGHARTFSFSDRPRYSTCVGSLFYKAPELLLGRQEYTPAVDEWSIGCIFGELLTGSYLFEGRNEIDVLKGICQLLGPPKTLIAAWIKDIKSSSSNRVSPHILSFLKELQKKELEEHPAESLLIKRFSIGSDWDRSGRDLLGRLLKTDPERRITACHCLTHPFFNDLDLTIFV